MTYRLRRLLSDAEALQERRVLEDRWLAEVRRAEVFDLIDASIEERIRLARIVHRGTDDPAYPAAVRSVEELYADAARRWEAGERATVDEIGL